MAAVLACGEDAVASHRWAGWLWGVVPAPRRLPEVTRETGWQGPRGVSVHRSPLPSEELCRIEGIPATGLARTFLDLAADLSQSALERALNEAEVQGLTDRLSIPELLERYPRRAGTAVLRRTLADERHTQGVTRKELEARFKVVLDGSDLPRPRRNVDIVVPDGHFNVDCLWAEQRVIVELDGRATHGTRRAFERDRERDRKLQAEGWRVVRVTWRQLRDEPAAVLADLCRMLGRAAPPTL
jgi:REase_MTES_1575